MDYTVHGIFQARILEWVAFPFSKGSSQPRDQTQVSRIVGGFSTSWATREAQEYWEYGSNWESNWGLLHCRWMLYQLNYQGSPCFIRVVYICQCYSEFIPPSPSLPVLCPQVHFLCLSHILLELLWGNSWRVTLSCSSLPNWSVYLTLHFKYKLKFLITPSVIKMILEVIHTLNKPNYIFLFTLT